jgi:hypothetical protein
MYNCFRSNLMEEFIEWIEHNLFEAIVLLYWSILIIVSIFSLVTESSQAIHLICPISHVWGDLLFQTIVSTYGLCCIAFIKRGDHDIISSRGKCIHYLDNVNIGISAISMLINIILLWETCNDKASHTGTYALATDHFFAIFILLASSTFMVLHKNDVHTRLPPLGTQRFNYQSMQSVPTEGIAFHV